MDDRFHRLVELELEYQRLKRQQDELFADDDGHTTGFHLLKLITDIRRVEDEIRELRRQGGSASKVSLG